MTNGLQHRCRELMIRWAGLPSSHRNFYRARPRLVILSSSRSPEQCSNHLHCTGSPMPLSIFRKRKLVYADVDLQSEDGSIWPLAFPAFDYERMLEQGYCAYLFAMRRGTAERSLAAGASNLYRLFNSVLDDEIISNANIVHLPGPLATLPQFDKNAAGRALAAAARAHLRQKGIRAEAAVSC